MPPRHPVKLKVGRRRWFSTVHRPFKFHVGVSFVGKPAQKDDKKLSPGQVFKDGALKDWRDEALAWNKGLFHGHAGHDFYFVQEVRPPLCSGATIAVAHWVAHGLRCEISR